MDPRLGELAKLHGIEAGYHDIWGTWRVPSDDTVRALLSAMGVDAHDPGAVETTLAADERDAWARAVAPITVLRGEAQLAQLSGHEPASESILREVDRLDAAVTMILSAARSRTGGGTRCDLRAAARRAIAGRSVDLAVPAGIDVDVPAELVVAVLSPLLDNSLRHASSHVRITARVQPRFVVIEVVDDGQGFDPADVDRVFEAGVTGGDGHGLGLAVVRRLAASAEVGVRAIADGHGRVEVKLPTPQETR